MKTIKFLICVFIFLTVNLPLSYAYNGSLLWEAGLGTNVAEYSAIRIADADGDGNQEIVVGNLQGFVHVLDYVSGDYTNLWRSPNIGTSAFGLAVGDPDGDTQPEIVAGNFEGFFYVFGYNSGSWVQEYVSGDFGRRVWGISIGDTDQDGVDELILAIEVSLAGVVKVLQFDGASYVEEWTSPDISRFVLDLSAADTDGDGDLEIAVGGGWADRAYIYEWTGAAYAQIWESDAMDSQNFGVAVANIDADASPELMASNLWGSMFVFSPQGPGSTTPEWRGTAGSYLYTPAVGDVDMDGTIEFAVGDRDGDLSIFGYSAGTYVLEDTVATGDASSGYGIAVREGDPDNDADLEWVTGGSPGIVRVFGYNSPPGYDQEWYSGPPNGPMHAMAAGDLDGDGVSEAVVGVSTASGGEEIFILGYDSGNFGVEWTWPELTGVVAGTMVSDDLDGAAGIEFAYISANDSRIHVFQYSGGTWVEQGSTDPVMPAFGSVPVATGNFDGTPPSKIAAVDGAGTLHVYGWNGTGFEEIWNGSIGFAQVQAASSADTDADLLDEIIMLDMMGTLRIWGWDGVNYSEEWASPSATFTGLGIAAADCDEDLVVEVAAGDASGNLHIYAFSGGVYAEEASVALGGGEISGASAGDVDADGRVELVVFDRSVSLSVVGYESGVWTVEGTDAGIIPSASGFNAPNPVAVLDMDGNVHNEVMVGLEGYLDVIQFPDIGPPDVTVISPNGGETIAGGSSFDVTWNAADIVGVDHVDIDYSVNSGTDWVPVAAGETNDGTYPWSVPETPSDQCLVRITAWDSAGNSAWDTSDDVFEIYLLAEEPMEEVVEEILEEMVEEIADEVDEVDEVDEADEVEDIGPDIAEITDPAEEEITADAPDAGDVPTEEVTADAADAIEDIVDDDTTVQDVVADFEDVQDAADVEQEQEGGAKGGCSCRFAI